MGFWIKKGQKCQLRIDERETEAVKIAVFNLAMDLEGILGVSVKVSQDDKEKGIPKILTSSRKSPASKPPRRKRWVGTSLFPWECRLPRKSCDSSYEVMSK